MEYSLPAWLGGLVGTIVAVVIYIPAIRRIEQRLREQEGPQTLEQRSAFEDKLSVVRRLILGADIAVLTALGSSDPQVRAHIRALRAIDVPWSEIEETILQTTPYAGIPRAVNAMKVLREEQETES